MSGLLVCVRRAGAAHWEESLFDVSSQTTVKQAARPPTALQFASGSSITWDTAAVCTSCRSLTWGPGFWSSAKVQALASCSTPSGLNGFNTLIPVIPKLFLCFHFIMDFHNLIIFCILDSLLFVSLSILNQLQIHFIWSQSWRDVCALINFKYDQCLPLELCLYRSCVHP